MPHRPVAVAFVGVVFAALGGDAAAQCSPKWLAAHSGPALNGTVRAIAEWDPDGPGPLAALPVVGGTFTTAGGTVVNNIAAWTHSGWVPVGAGTPGTTGGQLGGQVSALAVLPSGDLVAGGLFTTAGGVPAANIARFDGTSWHSMGDGLTGQGTATLGGVRALLVLPSGDLIAGGDFGASGATTLLRVARWSAGAWSPVGAGMTRQSGMVYTPAVFALALAPNGDIYAGGQWTHADVFPTQHVARFDGTGWQPLLFGFNAFVTALVALPGGDVIAGGDFTAAGAVPVTRVARWSAGAWSAMGSGFDGAVRGLTLDAAGNPVAVGFFTHSGGPTVNRAARWAGTAWTAMGSGFNGDALCARLLASGEVGAGGAFASAGGVTSYGLARWTAGNVPWLVTQPVPASAPCSGGVTFSITVAPGFAGVTYQWRREGAPITLDQNLTAGSATLVVEPVTPAAAGSYDCVVTSACNSVTSDAAALTVAAPCCVADFDENGFVNGDDSDSFAVLFLMGDIGADVNGDTFVTGDDFDTFMDHFLAGC